LNRQELAHELSNAWALVHPSLADTGPTIAKEARVVGLPVMLTTACGSQQHIDEGKSGFIVNANDISAMKESILRMTDSAETALSMGRYGQDDCRRKLSASTMIDTLMGIYQDILS
jgi:UDP-glucose:(heptosyl)LPS alpha-1,3-glucosyltransferase